MAASLGMFVACAFLRFGEADDHVFVPPWARFLLVPYFSILGLSVLTFFVTALLSLGVTCPSCGHRFFSRLNVLATSCAHCRVLVGHAIAPAIAIAERAQGHLAAFAESAGFRARGPLEVEGYRGGVLVRISLDPTELRARVEVDGACAGTLRMTRIELDADALDERKLEGAVGDVIEAAASPPTEPYR